MVVLCYILVVILSLAFIVSLSNCVNADRVNRMTDLIVSMVIFAMILGILTFIRNGG